MLPVLPIAAPLIPFGIWLYRKLNNKSLVVMGHSNSGKTALLWQLGLNEDFNPNEPKETDIDSAPIVVKFKGREYQVQDLSGLIDQRKGGGYDQYLKNNIIIIVFNGVKFLEEAKNKGTYYQYCIGIFRYVFDHFNKPKNLIQRLFNRKQVLITIASHEDQYISQGSTLKNDIKKCISGSKYAPIFKEGFFCADLHLEQNKEKNQKMIWEYINKQLP